MKLIRSLILISIVILTACSGGNLSHRERESLGVERYAEEIKRYEAYKYDWNYIYSFARAQKANDDYWASLISDYVMEFSCEYDLDPQIVTRKLWKESWCYLWAVSHLTDCNGYYIHDAYGRLIPVDYGASQINLLQNWAVFKEIDHGRLANQIWSAADVAKIILIPRYNIEAGCLTLRKNLNTYGQDYEIALFAYNRGPNASVTKAYARHKVPDSYVEEIMNAKIMEGNVTAYHDWKFIEKKKMEN